MKSQALRASTADWFGNSSKVIRDWQERAYHRRHMCLITRNTEEFGRPGVGRLGVPGRTRQVVQVIKRGRYKALLKSLTRALLPNPRWRVTGDHAFRVAFASGEFRHRRRRRRKLERHLNS